MDASLTFSDVLIRPKYSEVLSRSSSKVNISSTIGKWTLRLPVVSSNMKTITGPNMALSMIQNGGMGIMHRFNTIEEAVSDLKELSEAQVGVSIGVQEEDKKRFDQLLEAGARIFCIDVAHGHHILVKNMIQWISSRDIKDITLIAGNIATGEAVYDLADWGADIVKVGIGPGAVCVTRQRTGVGVPQLSALREVREEINRYKLKTQVLADGGIIQIGDIPKALKYADMVMIGSIISGTSETPGKVFRNPEGQFYKTYGGSASGENKNTNRFVEGMVKTVPFRGHVKYILREIDDGIRSAFSYVGAFNLKEFQEKCEFIHISSGGAQESKI